MVVIYVTVNQYYEVVIYVTVNQYYEVVIYVAVNQYYEVVISKYVNLPDLIVLFYEFCFSDILPGCCVEKGLL